MTLAAPPTTLVALRLRAALVALVCCLSACVAPRVQTPPSDPERPRLEQEVAVMDDGARLPLRAWAPAEPPRAVIVAVHGLNDYSAAFEGAGSFLAARGFAVYAFDQRGFGRTEQRGIWAGGSRLARDAARVAGLLRLRHPGIPMYAFGESMGGAVLLKALQHEPAGWVDAVVLSAPAVWSRSKMRRYQRVPLHVLAHSWRALKLSGRMLDRSPSDDPTTLRYLLEDPFVIRRTRVDVLFGLADLMDAVTSRSLPAGVPVLVLYGAHDEIVPPRPVCAWLERQRDTQGLQIALYPSGWHLLTRDRNATRVLADLAAWFDRPGTGLPSGADLGAPVERVCELAAGPGKGL